MRAMRAFGIILALRCSRRSAAASAALAQQQQQPVSALKGHDSNAPVDVTADRIEVQDRADRAIFAGNVHVTPGRADARHRAADGRLFAARGGSADPAASTRPAEWSCDSPSETARGDFGIYDLDRKLITLIGDVQLNRGDNPGQRLAAGDRPRYRAAR